MNKNFHINFTPFYLLVVAMIIMAGTTACVSVEDEIREYHDPLTPWERCEPFLLHPEPAWTNCMMIA